MRILVTGGAGFIGSHLVDRFVSLGHDVVALDDLSSGKRDNVNAGAKLIVNDVRGCSDAVRAVAPQVVVHHAAQMDVRKSVQDPAFDADVNLVGLLRVLEGARQGKALEHVIFASSGGAMYGEQSQFPAPETHAVNPESPYGLAKAVSEQYLAWYRRMYGVTSTSLRYGNVYGPRQNPHGEAGVVAIFCARILHGQPLTIFGDGAQTRDYVFVEDVVNANALALDKRPHGGFNVGTGVETDVNVLARSLVNAGVASGHAGTDIVHAEARAGEQKRSVIDPRAYEAAVGWRPTVSVEDGLARTFAWFAERQAAGQG
ncbi:MAG TPA: NAD-dependent epimerase/dehydratase family protein [Myxococcota bacterium]